jgi:molybdopterin converting factor small subunit
MATVRVQLPGLLTAAIGPERTFELEAETLPDALRAISADRPDLALHLFDESGGFREHVLCFWNETNTRWLDDVNQPLSDGDRLLFMQAVSGG